MASAVTEAPVVEEKLVRGLGLLDSTMLVAGSMIGSGIFIVSSIIARQLGSPGWLRVVAFDGTARRLGAHWISDIHEHARFGSRQAYPKCFYDRKNWRAARANRARNHSRVEVWCRRGKLQRLLDGAGGSARRRRRFD